MTSDGWMAEAGPDPAASAREIARAKDALMSGTGSGGGDSGIRPVIAQSWQRCADLDPDENPPVTLYGSDLDAYRTAHPLSIVIGLLRDLVGSVAEDGRHLMAVSDGDGRLLWVEGHAAPRRLAERMNFVEGAVWDEANAGTNAPGTALALDHAVQIFSAEHFRPQVQAWTCAAAPVHDPFTGRIIGIVDVTGGDIVAHPHSLALVTAAARAAEAQLAATLGWRRESGGALWVPEQEGGAPGGLGTGMRLLALGRDQAVVLQGGRETRLNRRHSEILVILAQHPEGLTADQLAASLYDDWAAEATVRVEVARLRRVLGDLVGSRPYRLVEPISADFLDVAKALRDKDPAAALAAYGGTLLPRSEAPEVIAERHWLDVRLRTAVIESGNAPLLEDWLDRCGADDLDAWERLVPLLPPSVRRSEALAEVRRLRNMDRTLPDATLR